MRNKRGIALVTILIICGILLAIVGIGLKLGANGVLFVSQAHKRNVALSAAEAGVYEAIVALQNDRNHTGTVTGTLTDANASYTYTLQNDLTATRTAEVVATGQYGDVKRTLRVELEPDSAGFDGINVGGKIYVFDQAYVNGISSPANPVPRPGHAHTEYNSASAPSFVAQDFGADGVPPVLKLHSSGPLTTRGSFDPSLDRTSPSESTSVSRPGHRLDRLEMENGTFTPATGLGPGTLASNTEVTLGDPSVDIIEVNGRVIVPKGMKLLIHGSVKFNGGLSGEGEVVVDKDVLIRTDANFDPTIQEGIKLLAGDSVFITHPEGSISSGIVNTTFNPVGDYFAQMPIQANSEISIGIPTSAPRGADFFTWFGSGSNSSDPEYQLWYDGDGTDIHPGLSQETKVWLNRSTQGSLATEITNWAAGASGP